MESSIRPWQRCFSYLKIHRTSKEGSGYHWTLQEVILQKDSHPEIATTMVVWDQSSDDWSNKKLKNCQWFLWSSNDEQVTRDTWVYQWYITEKSEGRCWRFFNCWSFSWLLEEDVFTKANMVRKLQLTLYGVQWKTNRQVCIVRNDFVGLVLVYDSISYRPKWSASMYI